MVMTVMHIMVMMDTRNEFVSLSEGRHFLIMVMMSLNVVLEGEALVMK